MTDLPRVHRYDSTGEAYDASQTTEAIRPGDVLVVMTEGVAGVLVDAWPTAVTDEAGEFHTLAEGRDWAELDGGKYLAAVAVARRFMTEPGASFYDEAVTCLDGPEGCSGAVDFMTTPDRDDFKTFPRCEAHFDRRLAEAERTRELLSDVPPPWFDEGYAGERWAEDY